jgi:ketosteroid isomerase-like protein
MKRLLMIMCLVFSLTMTLPAFAPDQSKPANTATSNSASPKAEDQVVQLERDWLAADAKGDVAGLRRIIADDFIGNSPDGHVLSKSDIVPQGGGPGGFAGATPGATSVRVFGDTAVLMGSIKTAAAPQSKDMRVTLVCQKRPQGWQMIAAHLAPGGSEE